MAASPPNAETPRRFAVHGAGEPASRAHRVEGESFEAAAMHFIADWATADEDDEVSLIVEGLRDGRAAMFSASTWRTGETAPCA